MNVCHECFGLGCEHCEDGMTDEPRRCYACEKPAAIIIAGIPLCGDHAKRDKQPQPPKPASEWEL